MSLHECLFDKQKYGLKSIQGTKIATLSWEDFETSIPYMGDMRLKKHRDAKKQAELACWNFIGGSFVRLEDVIQIIEELLNNQEEARQK